LAAHSVGTRGGPLAFGLSRLDDFNGCILLDDPGGSPNDKGFDGLGLRVTLTPSVLGMKVPPWVARSVNLGSSERADDWRVAIIQAFKIPGQAARHVSARGNRGAACKRAPVAVQPWVLLDDAVSLGRQAAEVHRTGKGRLLG